MEFQCHIGHRSIVVIVLKVLVRLFIIQDINSHESFQVHSHKLSKILKLGS